MADVFLKIVNMSISCCWIVPAVILLRSLLKKAPKWINCALWGLAGLRLVMPFSFESIFSLIPSAEFVPQEMIHSHSTVEVSGSEILNYAGNNPVWYELGISDGRLMFTEFTAPDGNYVNPLLIITYIASVVWVIGMVALMIYTVVSYMRLKSKIGTAVLFDDNIYQSENVVSPFVLGLIRPKIYLPFNINGQDMEHVVAHEQAHIIRKDHLWKPVGFLLLTIHWFNPFVWVGYILLCRDIELACDEKVVKKLDNKQRADYSQALLTCSVNRRLIAACPVAFGEADVKNRVKAVLSYKRPTFLIVAVAALASVAVAVCYLTNPVSHRLAHIEGFDLEGCLNEQTSVMVYDGETQHFVGPVENEILKELFDIKISKKEISLRRDEGRDKTNTLILNMSADDPENLTSYVPWLDFHFNADFTEVWVDNNVKPTFSYKVLNPQKAKDIYAVISGAEESDDSQSDKSNSNNGSELSGVSLAVADSDFSSSDPFIKIEWKNKTGNKILFGEAFSVYKEADGKWENCSMDEDPVWFTIAYIVRPGKTESHTYKLGRQRMNEPGRYRLEAFFSIDGQRDINYKAWVEFELTQGISVSGENNIQFSGYNGDEIISEPPALIVVSNEQSIEAAEGTSSWMYETERGLTQAVTSDSNHPLMMKEFTPVLNLLPTYKGHVQPLEARLQFNATGISPVCELPPDEIHIRCWSEKYWDNADAKSQDIEFNNLNGNLLFKLKDGNYIYEIIATWNSNEKFSGTVSYSFCTDKAEFDPNAYPKIGADSKVKDIYNITAANLIDKVIEDEEFVYTKTHYQMDDGIWCSGNYAYMYCLEITGRLNNASKNTTYLVLSNRKDITFEEAWKASGLSSNTADYFKAEDAVVVGYRIFG